ncbi:2-keto-4-pentenoate hydratase/2-oxohepta-3-ene-1,7-dioic acid hydratase in catechol pathway [Rhodopirellula rubra]|uniref:2-keto-4-pentenoate hydratase/2-oxohepta-3-ene-1,7-dioic acid hydratase in catechol pathway n=1 Tax=Aporhodopirellula rubra TaxID=980271 RepID=A0A7W5E2T6_9BACT|nr:fumarylacetoacetate hydrolase family protein [Aporhodopirellula rubra]MBB3208277.1 2-keto-4-pentenoate hydratase/2-oxohepta-3-ene-1,7-dioic acid hydratase in catechol pathway [Aporhodopirellula rubra]
MTAFCRYIDSSGKVRFALYQSHGSDASSPAKVCPLSSITDEATEEVLATDNQIFAWSAEQIAELPDPAASQWINAPAKLLPPVNNPEKVICIGLNYLDHAIETGSEPPELPVVFSKFNSSLIGHGDAIVLPTLSQKVDYEAELVVVIGRTARHVSKEDAMDYVFGFTAGHDVSARDWQKGRPGGQWLLGKTFDTFAPVGPAIVTKTQFGDGSDASVKMYLGNDLAQSSTTAQLIFDIPTLISHLSGFVTLRPGDLIFTGTPPGVGAARNPPRFLADGDVCTVEIEGIGRLTNPCRDEVTSR